MLVVGSDPTFLIAFAGVLLVVLLPYNTLRKKGGGRAAGRHKGVLLTEIRDLRTRKRTGTRRGGTAAVGHHRQPAGLARNHRIIIAPTLDPDSSLQARQLPDDLCR